MISKNENGLARITVDLPLGLQKKLKVIAALQGKSMREIVIASIEKQINKMEGLVDKIQQNS